MLVPVLGLRCDYTMAPLALPRDGTWLTLPSIYTAEEHNRRDSANNVCLPPRAPLPRDAELDVCSGRVRQPIEWTLSLTYDCFLFLSGAPATLLSPSIVIGKPPVQLTYPLGDVTRDTTLDAIAADVKAWLATRTWLPLPRGAGARGI